MMRTDEENRTRLASDYAFAFFNSPPMKLKAKQLRSVVELLASCRTWLEIRIACLAFYRGLPAQEIAPIVRLTPGQVMDRIASLQAQARNAAKRAKRDRRLCAVLQRDRSRGVRE